MGFLSNLKSEERIIKELGMCRKTFTKLRNDGIIPFYQVAARRRYNPEEVEAALLSKRVGVKIN